MSFHNYNICPGSRQQAESWGEWISDSPYTTRPKLRATACPVCGYILLIDSKNRISRHNGTSDSRLFLAYIGVL